MPQPRPRAPCWGNGGTVPAPPPDPRPARVGPRARHPPGPRGGGGPPPAVRTRDNPARTRPQNGAGQRVRRPRDSRTLLRYEGREGGERPQGPRMAGGIVSANPRAKRQDPPEIISICIQI